MKKRHKPQLIRILEYLDRHSKGLPVGVSVARTEAADLVSKGYAEYAPPVFRFKRPMTTVRLTAAGQAHLKIYHDGQKG